MQSISASNSTTCWLFRSIQVQLCSDLITLVSNSCCPVDTTTQIAQQLDVPKSPPLTNVSHHTTHVSCVLLQLSFCVELVWAA